MAKLTNVSGGPRALPLKNKKHVTFAKGETKDFPDADFASIKNRTSVAAHFRVETLAPVAAQVPVAAEVSEQDAPAEPVPAPRRGRPKKD